MPGAAGAGAGALLLALSRAGIAACKNARLRMQSRLIQPGTNATG